MGGLGGREENSCLVYGGGRGARRDISVSSGDKVAPYWIIPCAGYEAGVEINETSGGDESIWMSGSGSVCPGDLKSVATQTQQEFLGLGSGHNFIKPQYWEFLPTFLPFYRSTGKWYNLKTNSLTSILGFLTCDEIRLRSGNVTEENHVLFLLQTLRLKSTLLVIWHSRSESFVILKVYSMSTLQLRDKKEVLSDKNQRQKSWSFQELPLKDCGLCSHRNDNCLQSTMHQIKQE